jgi:hypothetical protein
MVDSQIQPFEGAGTEEHEIGRLGEHDIVRRRDAFDVHDCIPDVSLEHPAVGNDEPVAPLGRDSQFLEDSTWNPRQLTAGVDEDVIQLSQRAASRCAFYGKNRSKRSHVTHSNRLWRAVRIA